jgi:integrase
VNVVVLAEESARLSARTVNRMLSNVVGFYEFQARRGSTLAHDLVVKTRSGRGGYEPFLYGIARSRPRGRAVRLPERQSLPSTLSLEQVGAVIDCRERLRDRFLFALLASTGMRVGQALGLRHEDVVAWERRIVIRARDGAPRRARSKGGAEGGVPVPGELMRLWSDYMHEEYRDLDCDFSYSRLRNGWRALVCPPHELGGVPRASGPLASAPSRRRCPDRGRKEVHRGRRPRPRAPDGLLGLLLGLLAATGVRLDPRFRLPGHQLQHNERASRCSAQSPGTLPSSIVSKPSSTGS